MINVELEPSGIARITLDRPEKRNAINDAGYLAFGAALRRLRSAPQAQAIVLHGANGAFCAGTDLAELDTAWPQDHDGPLMQFLRELADAEAPLIAAVDGCAIGIGATLLLHCDMVFLSPRSWLQYPFVKLGLAAEGGASQLLPATVGRLRAAELLLTGRRIDAAEAVALGLATAVDTCPLETALPAAAQLALQPLAAVRAVKRSLAPDSASTHDLLWREISVINGLLVERHARGDIHDPR